MAGTTVSVSPWGATWPLLSLLCTIGALACVAELLEALTRRVERARWVVVPAASLPCFARWVVRFRLECNSVPCARNHSGSLSRKTASTTCWSFAILAALIGAFSPWVTPYTIAAVPRWRVVEIRYTHASLKAAAADALLIGSTLVSYACFRSLPSSLTSLPTAPVTSSASGISSTSSLASKFPSSLHFFLWLL